MLGVGAHRVCILKTAIAILRQWQEDCGWHFAVQRNRVHLQHCNDSAVHGTVAVVSTSFARQRCSQQHNWHDSAVLDIALVAKCAVAGKLARASRARQRGARLRGGCLVIMDAHSFKAPWVVRNATSKKGAGTLTLTVFREQS